MAKATSKSKALARPQDLMRDADALLAQLDTTAKGDATADDIQERMGGMPELEAIKIKHAGANVIVMPDDSIIPGGEGFVAVILASNFHNQKWPHGYDSKDRVEGERPLCKASDGITIDPGVDDPQARNCTVCPLNCAAKDPVARDNAFNLDRDDRCSNALTLVLQRPGMEIPERIDLSSSSFRAWDRYVQRVGSKTRFLPCEVATRITFAMTGQHQHSVARFELLGALPPDLRKVNREAEGNYLSLLRTRYAGSIEKDSGPESATPPADAPAADAKSPI